MVVICPLVLLQEKMRGLAYIEQIESKFGVEFEEDRNPDVEFMAHLWEPLRWMHKPLAVYLFAECMSLATDCLLYVLGFRAFKHHNVSPQAPYVLVNAFIPL